MLTPCYTHSKFTGNKSHLGASGSNIKKPRQRAAGREYMVYDEKSDKHIQRGVLKQKKVVEAKRARQEAVLMREEQAKQANMDNITTLVGMTKEEFRSMRS